MNEFMFVDRVTNRMLLLFRSKILYTKTESHQFLYANEHFVSYIEN